MPREVWTQRPQPKQNRSVQTLLSSAVLPYLPQSASGGASGFSTYRAMFLRVSLQETDTTKTKGLRRRLTDAVCHVAQWLKSGRDYPLLKSNRSLYFKLFRS